MEQTLIPAAALPWGRHQPNTASVSARFAKPAAAVTQLADFAQSARHNK